VSLVGNFAEVGENFRFRFVVDPLVVSLVAAGIHRLLRRAQRRGRPPSAEQSKVYM
jgi:hypothetical protein